MLAFWKASTKPVYGVGLVYEPYTRLVCPTVHAQVIAMKDEMKRKDDMIMQLTVALESKSTHEDAKLKTPGEFVELSIVGVKALEKRVEACERKNEAQDVEIGMAVTIAHEIREERGDGTGRTASALPARPLSPSIAASRRRQNVGIQ